MARTFLHCRKHGTRLAGLDIDHPVRMQPHPGQSGCEKVAAAHAPQDRSLQPRQDAGDEQGGGGAMAGIARPARHFMQRAKRQPAAGQTRVDLVDPERQDAASAACRAFESADALAKRIDDGWSGGLTHVACKVLGLIFVLYLFQLNERVNRLESPAG